MSASSPDQSVHYLISLADASARLVSGRAKRLESAYDDSRQTALAPVMRPILAGSNAESRGEKDLREAIEAEARVVDQPAGQHLRKTQSRQLHARRTTVW